MSRIPFSFLPDLNTVNFAEGLKSGTKHASSQPFSNLFFFTSFLDENSRSIHLTFFVISYLLTLLSSIHECFSQRRPAWIGGGKYALLYIFRYVPVHPATTKYLPSFSIYWQLSLPNEYIVTMLQSLNLRRRSIPQSTLWIRSALKTRVQGDDNLGYLRI